MKKISTNKKVVIAIYLFLWVITQIFGAENVRSRFYKECNWTAKHIHPLKMPEKDKPTQYAYMSYPIAISPFILIAGNSWRMGPLRGAGGVVLAFWFFGFQHRSFIDFWKS